MLKRNDDQISPTDDHFENDHSLEGKIVDSLLKANGSEDEEKAGKDEVATKGKSKLKDQLLTMDIPASADDYEISYGDGVVVDEMLDQQFREFAHEHKISAELAQKIVDFNNKIEDYRSEYHARQMEEWLEQAKHMQGFEGAAFDRNLAIANRALNTFASKELSQIMHETGFCNHPEVIKAFYNVGLRMAEDKFATGKPHADHRSAAEVLYPNHPA